MIDLETIDFRKEYLRVVFSRFDEMKATAEKAMNQIEDEAIFWTINEESNSIAVIIRHMAGHMVSRWTDFLTTDGEKQDRNRDSEFDEVSSTREELMGVWNNGWKVLLDSLHSIDKELLSEYITIQGNLSL